MFDDDWGFRARSYMSGHIVPLLGGGSCPITFHIGFPTCPHYDNMLMQLDIICTALVPLTVEEGKGAIET